MPPAPSSASTESAAVAASKAFGLTLALVFGGLILPFVGPLLLATAGAPIGMAVVRHGWRIGALVALAVAVVAALLAGAPAGLMVLGVFMGFGVLVGESLRGGSPFHAVVTAATFLVSASVLAVGLGVWTLSGVDLYAQAVTGLRGALDQVVDLYKTMGADAQVLSAFTDVVRQTRSALPTFLPGMILIGLVAMAVGSTVVADKLLARAEGYKSTFRRFQDWRIPWPWSWAFGLALGCLLLQSYLGATGQLGSVLLGVGRSALLIFGTLYFLQGLAVGYFYLARWRTSVFWVVLLATLVVMIPLLGQTALLFGLMDTWFDFRRNGSNGKGVGDRASEKGPEDERMLVDHLVDDDVSKKDEDAASQRKAKEDGGD